MKKLKHISKTCCMFLGAASLLLFATVTKAQIKPPVITCCANAGPNHTVSCGGTITIGATGAWCPNRSCPLSSECPSTYSWSPSTGLSCTTCANPVIYNCTGGSSTYTVTYSLTVNCPDGGFNGSNVTIVYDGCC